MQDMTPREVLERHGWAASTRFDDPSCFSTCGGHYTRHIVVINCDDGTIEPRSTDGCWQTDEHHRRVFVAFVDSDAYGQDVLRVLAEHIGELADLARRWRGTRWDGANHVGDWDWSGIEDPEFGLLDDVHYGFQRKLCPGHGGQCKVRVVWHLDELFEWWFGDDPVDADTDPEEEADEILRTVANIDGVVFYEREALIEGIKEHIEEAS